MAPFRNSMDGNAGRACGIDCSHVILLILPSPLRKVNVRGTYNRHFPLKKFEALRYIRDSVNLNYLQGDSQFLVISTPYLSLDWVDQS